MGEADMIHGPSSLLGTTARMLFASKPLRLGGRRRGQPIDPRCVVLVGLGENPTVDYYLRPRLDGTVAQENYLIASTTQSDPDVVLDAAGEGVFVLFCRYFSQAWVKALEDRRERLAGVGLFVDDDIVAVIGDPTIRIPYKLRLVRNHFLHRRRLGNLVDRLWVSTRELGNRFPEAGAEVLPPVPSAFDAPRQRPARRRQTIAFHATGVHELEHAWLAPIVERLLQQRPDLDVEVIADKARARYWRAIDGVRLQTVMPWLRYREYTANNSFDLLLAPLFDTPVNRSRSLTKRIDAYRAGAALLTTAPWVYDPSDEETALGMSAPHSDEAFLTAITSLLDDPARLARLASLNRERVNRMALEARSLFATGG